MFTGIVEEIGRIQAASFSGDNGRLSILAKKVTEGTRLGDSIAVNGICLTVTDISPTGFSADVTSSTFRAGSFASVRIGDFVNLERAMPLNGRFGGHLVSGHIDGTGELLSLQRDGNALRLTIAAPPSIMALIVEKGSVCVDGVSLTVAALYDASFEVCIIPHTGAETTLLRKRRGSLVNLENDVVGKYVQRLLFPPPQKEEEASALTMDFLKKYGI